MTTAIRQTATVQADGRLDVFAPELAAGTVTEVIVLVASEPQSTTIAERLAALKQLQDSLKLTPDSAAAWMREVQLERQARRLPGDSGV